MHRSPGQGLERGRNPDAVSVTHPLQIAVIIPCFNEEAAVRTVVEDVRTALPSAAIYVYDNNSDDATADVAQAAGAIVRTEKRKGKGNVVRRAFADVDADVYVLIDGDDTYDAGAAPALVRELLSGPYDHVVGVRPQSAGLAYRAGHATGNRVLTAVVQALFGRQVTDLLSGYRAFSRRYVKSFPALSQEFEIETEMTVHSLALRLPVSEVAVAFKERPLGSKSKLRTYRDGWRILMLILRLTRHERPTLLYGAVAAMLGLVAVALGTPLVLEYLRTGLVPRFPTAILASALATIAISVFAIGHVLDEVQRGREESARLSYLRHPALDPGRAF